MEINSMDEFYHQLAAAKDRLTVVYFYYSYCGSCLQVLPKWKEVVRSHAGISFLKVEVKDVVKVVEVFELTQVPTFVALLKQEEINRYTGSQSKELLNFIATSMEEYEKIMNKSHGTAGGAGAEEDILDEAANAMLEEKTGQSLDHELELEQGNE